MEDEFEPSLGKIRSSGSRRGRRYLHRVLAAASRAGLHGGNRKPRFDGSRIGRGAGAGRLLERSKRTSGNHARRAIVKTRLVRLSAGGLRAARAHLAYLERDGTQRDGSPGHPYSAAADQADGRAFIERCADDRHQFRLILSAEDGTEYDDLKPLVRRLMSQMERDLGTGLEWVAIDHTDTAHPHSHVILRGRDDKGENLIISREYIRHGMRERLAELVTLDLGPQHDLDVLNRQRQEIGAERLTSIDRTLINRMALDHSVTATDSDMFRHSLQAGRLKKLESLGLADPLSDGRWRLASDVERRLRDLGERHDIVRTLQRQLSAKRIERSPAEWAIGPLRENDAIVGSVIGRGLADEAADRHYMIIDGIDGRVHYVDVGDGASVEDVPASAIVRLSATTTLVREVDRTVAAIASENGGEYSEHLHQIADPSASAGFIQSHVRRLEAMRRAGAPFDRRSDGSWSVPADLLDHAREFEISRARAAPVRLELLSPIPIKDLATHDGATWLDRRLSGDQGDIVRDAGFGGAVRSALALRRQWLIQQQLGTDLPTGFQVSDGALGTLRSREIAAKSAKLSADLGKAYVPVADGELVAGRLCGRIDLASGRFALIENSHQFSLVPWRPFLERHLGREVEGIVRGERVSWSFGRERSGPSI